MYMFINAMVLALLASSGAPESSNVAACRAEVKGLRLVTTVQLPGGVLIEGPWSIEYDGKMREGRTHFRMVATLDRVVERDVVTGARKVIPFPEPVRLAFEGPTQEELVHRAAHVWCVTVMRAKENQALDQLPANRGSVTRVTLAAGSAPRVS